MFSLFSRVVGKPTIRSFLSSVEPRNLFNQIVVHDIRTNFYLHVQVSVILVHHFWKSIYNVMKFQRVIYASFKVKLSQMCVVHVDVSVHVSMCFTRMCAYTCVCVITSVCMFVWVDTILLQTVTTMSFGSKHTVVPCFEIRSKFWKHG